jgi:hypothetical protein
MSALALFAAQGIPPSSPMAKLVVPIGALIFLGSIYLLLRSNLGTRRGYFVFATAFFGFLIIQSAFWAFGAPGTPVATGPTNLPGQVPNEYQPTWYPFAPGSRLALEEFPWVDDVEFGAVPEHFEDEADAGVTDIQTFFSDEEHGELVGDDWEAAEIGYAEPEGAEFPVLRVTYLEVDQAGERLADGDVATFYAFFDAGNRSFPAVLLLLISLVLFVIHAFFLDRHEQREKRELRELRGEEREPELAQA